MQGRLPPYGSTLWDEGDIPILVARIPGKDPDLVNDVERVAEWASSPDVLKAQACLLLTAGKVHTLPMAPIRSHVERRIALDRRQAGRLRRNLPPGLSWKLFRAVDDPYRRVRLGILFPDERMRDVDDDRLDELAVKMGSVLRGDFDDVHCVHLVSATDDVRIAPDSFLADMLPRLQDDRRRVDAQERLLQRQHDDARARGEETDALRRHLVGGDGVRVAAVKRKDIDRDNVDWEAGSDDRMASIHAQVDALGGRPDTDSTGGTAMSRLRRHLMDAGYTLRIHPDVPGHAIDLAADRPDRAPERIIAWSVPVLDRDTAERALAATRDLGAALGVVVAPQADADGQRVLVATRVRWLPPERIEGLRL